ncbi:MAG: leucyl/phenylalanyl-tRNA--protein transferase [Betaproteobacteria bacterium]|nr:leucyl/phenylalanyl-tRNA--protein transferase [Betaproteobacteria bacterium]
MIPWLDNATPFPPLESALREPNGLLAAGGDLSPRRLVAAYSKGIFPWFSPGEPILWWSPDPRMVLFPADLKISRSLRKTLKKSGYAVRADTAFRTVMQQCAAPRDGQPGTWISPAMIAAYTELHEQGIAHSVETWANGKLVGGLYGVALGRMFYGESMFSLASDTSKIAFVHLARQLERWGFGMIDCQMKTAHLATLGAREIPRAEFGKNLAKLVNLAGITGPWRFDNDLAE